MLVANVSGQWVVVCVCEFLWSQWICETIGYSAGSARSRGCRGLRRCLCQGMIKKKHDVQVPKGKVVCKDAELNVSKKESGMWILQRCVRKMTMFFFANKLSKILSSYHIVRKQKTSYFQNNLLCVHGRVSPSEWDYQTPNQGEREQKWLEPHLWLY